MIRSMFTDRKLSSTYVGGKKLQMNVPVMIQFECREEERGSGQTREREMSECYIMNDQLCAATQLWDRGEFYFLPFALCYCLKCYCFNFIISKDNGSIFILRRKLDCDMFVLLIFKI